STEAICPPWPCRAALSRWWLWPCRWSSPPPSACRRGASHIGPSPPHWPTSSPRNMSQHRPRMIHGGWRCPAAHTCPQPGHTGRVLPMRKRRLWTVLVPVAAVVLGTPALASPAAGDGSQQVLHRVLARQFARSPLAPGISARVDAPGLHWAGAMGLADKEAGTPLRGTGTFRSDDVCQAFTAAAVLCIVTRGLVTL